MKQEDVYEQWKASRASIKAPTDFAAAVAARVATNEPIDDDFVTQPQRGILERPVWAALAIMAASVIGLVRVTVALLFGIT